MTEDDKDMERRITLYRGVPSTSFPELLDDTTWHTRWIGGEEEARWVVPEGEDAYMEIGVVALGDIVDPNWDQGWVTIPDVGAIDVRHLVAVEGCLRADDVRAEFERIFVSDQTTDPNAVDGA